MDYTNFEDIYTTMIDQDETWYVYETGSAFIMNDAALADC